MYTEAAENQQPLLTRLPPEIDDKLVWAGKKSPTIGGIADRNWGISDRLATATQGRNSEATNNKTTEDNLLYF